jgi:hypothetical protein
MIEVVHHLRLDERQRALLLEHEVVAVEPPSRRLELGTRAKQARVVGHVQHGHEAQAPRIAIGVVLAPQDARAPVDREVEVGVATGAEGRARAGVRVERREVGGCEGEVSLRIPKFFDVTGKEEKIGGTIAISQRQQTELESCVSDFSKEAGAALKVEQRPQRIVV